MSTTGQKRLWEGIRWVGNLKENTSQGHKQAVVMICCCELSQRLLLCWLFLSFTLGVISNSKLHKFNININPWHLHQYCLSKITNQFWRTAAKFHIPLLVSDYRNYSHKLSWKYFNGPIEGKIFISKKLISHKLLLNLRHIYNGAPLVAQ